MSCINTLQVKPSGLIAIHNTSLSVKRFGVRDTVQHPLKLQKQIPGQLLLKFNPELIGNILFNAIGASSIIFKEDYGIG